MGLLKENLSREESEEIYFIAIQLAIQQAKEQKVLIQPGELVTVTEPDDPWYPIGLKVIELKPEGALVSDSKEVRLIAYEKLVTFSDVMFFFTLELINRGKMREDRIELIITPEKKEERRVTPEEIEGLKEKKIP